MCKEIELLTCVGLDYQWGENPIVDEYATRYCYPEDAPITFIGVLDSVNKVVSFIAAFPDGEVRLFKDSPECSETYGSYGGSIRLKRVLETDYLVASDKDSSWHTSIEKPIPLSEELQEVAITDFDASRT